MTAPEPSHEHAIRPAREADLPRLREIERAAGAPFAELDMTLVAEDEPPTIAALLEYQRAGRAWVYAGKDGHPLAYLLADEVDGKAHLEQVSVHPEYAHRRIGRGLIENLADWARARGMPAITLTSYTEVPWNGPYYQRCGFRYLAETELTPGLREIRAAEAAHGLDAWPRACMSREL